MSVQQPAQHRQQANTVYVAVPKAGDTVTVRVASGTVQVRDTLHAVVRQTGGEWYLIGTLVLTAALIGVTVWTHRQMHRLQKRNTDLQAEHARLQREFNEMQVQHEKERREAERQREEEQRRATGARISGTAFALRRQLISWTDEAPEEVKTLVQLADAWRGVYRASGHPIPDGPADIPGVDAVLEATVKWAHGRQKHFDKAEERVLQLVAAAPDGTPKVAESIRGICAVFFQATSRLSQQVAAYSELNVANELELASAYHEIELCALELGTPIGAELLIASAEMARRDSLPESEA